MVLDRDALESLTVATVALPCDVVVLEDARSGLDANEGFALIDTQAGSNWSANTPTA